MHCIPAGLLQSLISASRLPPAAGLQVVVLASLLFAFAGIAPLIASLQKLVAACVQKSKLSLLLLSLAAASAAFSSIISAAAAFQKFGRVSNIIMIASAANLGFLFCALQQACIRAE